MPQIVQAQVGDLGFTAPLERPADHRAIQGREERISPHHAGPRLEYSGDGVIDRNCPPLVIFGMTQGDRPPAQFDITPAQQGDFRAPHARVHRQVHDRAKIRRRVTGG